MTATEVAGASVNSTPDFGFERLEIEDKTARLDLPMVSPEAHLILRPATPENSKYTAGSLRMGGKRQRQIAAGAALTSAGAEQDRKEDRILYPKYVFVSWGGIFDKHGELVPANAPNVKAFFAKLPTWIFDKVRLFCMRPERFVGDENDAAEYALPEVTEMAEN